jgi:hypothetical protein
MKSKWGLAIVIFLFFLFLVSLWSDRKVPPALNTVSTPAPPSEKANPAPSKQEMETQITKEQLVEYFSKDLGFTFGKEYNANKGDMEISGTLENKRQYVDLIVTYNSSVI